MLLADSMMVLGDSRVVLGDSIMVLHDNIVVLGDSMVVLGDSIMVLGDIWAPGGGGGNICIGSKRIWADFIGWRGFWSAHGVGG